MATNFHANQYEDAFIPPRLQNWEVPKQKKGTVPKPQEGFTEITANDRGHILDGYPRSAKNPWGDFIGTWDFPKQIPGNCATVVTARRDGSEDKLRRHLLDAKKVMTGAVKNEQRQLKGLRLRKNGVTNPTPMNAQPLSSSSRHRSYHHVTMDPDFIQEEESHRLYPKTHYPVSRAYSPPMDTGAEYNTKYAGFNWDQAHTSRPCSTGSVEYVQVNAL